MPKMSQSLFLITRSSSILASLKKKFTKNSVINIELQLISCHERASSGRGQAPS